MEMLCKLMESLLFTRGGPDFNMDPNKLNILICTTFVFCYLWSIGGNIVDTNWDAFDTFVRQQFDDNGDAKVNSCLDRWMDDLQFYIHFYSISVLSG